MPKMKDLFICFAISIAFTTTMLLMQSNRIWERRVTGKTEFVVNDKEYYCIRTGKQIWEDDQGVSYAEVP